MKDLLELISLSMNVVAKLTVGIGILVLFYYCFFEIHFFPTGVTVGDTLFFVFTALAFGTFYFFWIMLGVSGLYFVGSPFFDELGRKETKRERIFTFVCGAFQLFGLGLWAFLLYQQPSLQVGFWGALAFFIFPLVSGFFILLATSFWKDKPEGSSVEERESHAKMRIVVLFVALLFPISISALFVNPSFQNLGFRKSDVSLILSKENYNHIKDIAKDLYTPLFTCSPDANQDSVIIHNATVLWHGIGERSLVKIAVPTYDGKTAEVTVELESKGINIFETNSPSGQAHETIKSCTILKTDSLFDTYSATPNQVGIARIEEFKKKIDNYIRNEKLNVDAVTIAGYADQAPVRRKGDSNLALSKRRAEAVAERIADLYSGLRSRPEAIHIAGNGSLMPKSNCGEHLSALELEECRAIDRRVEIEFTFSRTATEETH